MKLTKQLMLAVVLSLVATVASAQTAAPPKKIDASEPSPKKDNGQFLKQHETFVKRTKEGPIGVLFLGDSITAGWTKAPEVWEKYYKKYSPANFGIGGDQTQHVLWRVTNGELEGISPKVVVLMLGTNNTATHDAREIAAADIKIVQTIRSKLPNAKVLLLAIFPRGPRKNRDGSMDDGSKRMEIIRGANAQLARLDDGKMVRFLDIGPKFLDAQGKIPSDIMPDQLHPNTKGYQIWAEAMKPLLSEMMGSP